MAFHPIDRDTDGRSRTARPFGAGRCQRVARWHALHLAGAFFVTRAKSNMKAHRGCSTPTDRDAGIICDRRIALDGRYTNRMFATAYTPEPVGCNHWTLRVFADKVRFPEYAGSQRVGRQVPFGTGLLISITMRWKTV